MIYVRIAPIAVLLALAACQDAPETAANEVIAAGPADVVTLPPDESSVPPPPDAGNNSADDGGNATEPAPATTIPAAFHGRWGMVPADCTSTRGDAKGLLTIDANTLRFYESRGTLTEVTGSYPEKLVARYSFVGEGQEWTKDITLELTGSSNTLIRTETDPPGRYTYTRCGT